MYVLSAATLLAQAVQDLDTGGPFDTNKIALYTNDVYPNRNSAVADFEIGNFGGLTNLKSIVWGAPFVNTLQQAEAMAALLNWLTTATTDLPATAYGYIITDTAGTGYVLGERFATPVTFNVSGQNLGLIPRLVWDT